MVGHLGDNQFLKEGVLMTQQELEARVAVLEARIRVVEDIEEIKKLLATYEE